MKHRNCLIPQEWERQMNDNLPPILNLQFPQNKMGYLFPGNTNGDFASAEQHFSDTDYQNPQPKCFVHWMHQDNDYILKNFWFLKVPKSQLLTIRPVQLMRKIHTVLYRLYFLHALK